MSQENVEIVREIFEAFAGGDFRASVDHLDPHVVVVVGREFPDPGAFLGPEGVRDLTKGFFEQWGRLTMSAQEIRPFGDSVLVRVLQRGTGRRSGAESEMTYFWICSFRGPKIIRLESVRDEGQALHALGSRE